MEYEEIIKKAGGLLIESSCPGMMRYKPEEFEVLATNSCKQAHYSPGFFQLDTPKYGVRYGKTKDVIDAAITGNWKGEWRPNK